MVISKLYSGLLKCFLILFCLSNVLEANDNQEPLIGELRQDQPKTDLVPAGEVYILPFGRPS